MRIGVLAVIAGVSLIMGCAHHGMDHGSMSHEEMMQHCQMMAEHTGEAEHDPSRHDPARHGGMSHEEMQRHCEAMRAQDQPAPQQH
jgi:hypothetical protein